MKIERDNSNIDRENLEQLMESILFNSSRSDNAVFHMKTVGNFIYYFDQLMNKQKETVYKNLNEYLIIVNKERLSDNFSREDSMALFDEYLLPISTIYRDYLGFSFHAKSWLALVWMSAIALVLFIFGSSIYYYIMLAAVFILYYVRIYTQIKKRKIYGYFY